MDVGSVQVILDGLFRINPKYEFVSFEDMSRAESDALGALRVDGDCAGILRPERHSGLRIKSACSQTAQLLQGLKTAGRLPENVRGQLAQEGCEPILELLLDDILQIFRNGRFESGPLVSDLLKPTSPQSGNLGYLASLSRDALQYGQRLAIDDPQRLAAQMYFYNRTPVTPQWDRRIGDPAQFERFLGTDRDGRCGQLLRAGARRIAATQQSKGWDIWALKDDDRPHGKTFDYKIYVSPSLEAMPEVLPIVLEVFFEHRVPLFKVGSNLPGLARPDKIIAYFGNFEQVEAVGARLAERIAGAPVHGVPFTAELFADGMISWGMDPHEARMFDWQERASWRVWVAHHLARSLVDSRRTPNRMIAPWQFALERLRLDGVDPDTWTPTPVYQDKIQR